MANFKIITMKKLSLLFILISIFTQAQTLEKGTVIKDYGQFYKIENPDFNLNPQKKYHVIFDIRKATNDVNETNPLLDTAARFINMHVAEGIPLENLTMVIVFHGLATKDVLSNKAYQEKFRKDNPSLDLLNKLNDLGVKIYVCGQSASHYDIKKEQVAKSVKFALSALSVLIEYQSDGYQLIDFN